MTCQKHFLSSSVQTRAACSPGVSWSRDLQRRDEQILEKCLHDTLAVY